MSQKPFYLSSRNGVWYARITDPNTGKVLPAKSTGESSKESAYLVAAQWVYSGNVPTGQKKKKKSIHVRGKMFLPECGRDVLLSHGNDVFHQCGNDVFLDYGKKVFQ